MIKTLANYMKIKPISKIKLKKFQTLCKGQFKGNQFHGKYTRDQRDKQAWLGDILKQTCSRMQTQKL